MRQITTIVLLIFGALAVIGAIVYWPKDSLPVPTLVKTNPSPTPPAVEEFINQSVMENRESETAAERKSENAQPVPQVAGAVSICQGAEETNFDCYEQHYQSVVDSQGVAAAMADLWQRYQGNAYAQSQCHPLTHVIGRAAVKNFANVAEAYQTGDSFCWSGYYHGVLEGIIGRIGYQNLFSQLADICTGVAAPAPYSFDHYNCVHGLGHGIMAITNDELPQSLEICDELSDSWERKSCWSGVFMENIIVDNINHFTKYLKPEDPLYPCNAIADQYRQTCYLMQTSYMLKVTRGDFAKVFALCEQAEQNYQPTCYQSLGRDASGRSVSNVAQTKAWCNLGQTAVQRQNCIIGAVKDFISYYHSDQQARELCQALADPATREICVSTVENYDQIF